MLGRLRVIWRGNDSSFARNGSEHRVKSSGCRFNRDLKLVEFSPLKFLSRVLEISKSFLTSNQSINRIERNPRIEFIESDRNIRRKEIPNVKQKQRGAGIIRSALEGGTRGRPRFSLAIMLRNYKVDNDVPASRRFPQV